MDSVSYHYKNYLLNIGVLAFLFIVLLLHSTPTLASTDPDLQAKIKPGDVIHITLPGEKHFNKNFTVNKDGIINLPEVKPIKLSGLTWPQAKTLLRTKLGEVYLHLDQLVITLKERRLLIKILGYVRKPGWVNLPPDANVQMAITKAGGLLLGAQMNKLQLKRNNKVIVFNFKKYLDTGNHQILPKLQSGDTLFVPSAKVIGNIRVDYDAGLVAKNSRLTKKSNTVKVFGEVHQPGAYEYRKNDSIIDYLLRAGGVTRYAGTGQIRVIINNHPYSFDLKRYLDTGKQQLLPPIKVNAIIFVPQKISGVKSGINTVYVMGEVQNPGAFESKNPAPVIDLLANAGGPTRYANTRSIRILTRDGKVTEFNLEAYSNGQSQKSPPIVKPGSTIFVAEKPMQMAKSWLKIPPSRAVRLLGAVFKPGRYEWSDEMTLVDLIAHGGGPRDTADLAHLKIIYPNGRAIKYNLEHFIKYGGEDSSLPKIESGSTVIVPELPRSPHDNKGLWIRQEAKNSIYVFGQVNKPGRYAFNRSMGFLDIISAADGPTETADINNINIIHRNNLKPELSHVNLALYFETGDATLIPRVIPGDAIYVPSRKRNWINKSSSSTVRVFGAVNEPGRYAYTNDMTLLDLLAQAGGPTDKAYEKRIVVIHKGLNHIQASSFNLVYYAKKGNPDDLPLVRPGDTVFVPYDNSSIWREIFDKINDVSQLLVILKIAGVVGDDN